MNTPRFDRGWRLGWGLSVEQLRELHKRAAEMRRNPTEPEKRLWRHLSNSQLEGHKFRRQSVLGWFIADFLCAQKALIVEVDGDTHDQAKDRLRDDVLARRGFCVVRVTNDDVMSNMDGVLTLIAAALAAAPRRWNNPHPSPSPEGEGLERAQSHPSPGKALEEGESRPSPSGEGTGVGPVSREGQELLGISVEGSVR